MAKAPARYLIFAFTWNGLTKIKELDDIFGLAYDWLRISNSCWIIWSNTDVTTWADRVKKVMGNDDNVIISDINLSLATETYSGWQKKWVWDWIQKDRSHQT